MLRAALLSLVFAVAVGPSLPTLCKAWCATQAADSSCHHGDRGGTTRVEKDNSWQAQVLVATTTYKEDTRRRTPPDDVAVWAVTRSTLRAHLAYLRSLDLPHPARSDPRSAVSTPLRI